MPPLEIGGDWYDVLRVGDHRIGIIVGDCVGRGLSAAAVMGQLRASARALLLTGAEPARLLEELDAVAELIPDAFCTTVFFPSSTPNRVNSLTAVPAIRLRCWQRRGPSTPDLGRSLGSVTVQRKASRPRASVTLPPGSTLMLYTEALVERRDVSLDDGIKSRRDGRTRNKSDRRRRRGRGTSELAPPGGTTTTSRSSSTGGRTSRWRSPIINADQLGVIRHQLACWLQGAGVAKERVADIVLAVNEAVANSIEHGYQGQSWARFGSTATTTAGV